MTQADEMRSAEAQNILRKIQSTIVFMAVTNLNNNSSLKNSLSESYLQKIDEYSNKTSGGGEITTIADTNEPLSPIIEEDSTSPHKFSMQNRKNSVSSVDAFSINEIRETNSKFVLLKPPPGRQFRHRPPPAVQIVKGNDFKGSSTAASTPAKLPND